MQQSGPKEADTNSMGLSIHTQEGRLLLPTTAYQGWSWKDTQLEWSSITIEGRVLTPWCGL